MKLRDTLRIIRLAANEGLDADELRELLLPRIAGAAAIDNAIFTNTSSVAASTVEASLLTSPATGVPLSPVGPGRLTPAALAFAFVPSFTGVTSTDWAFLTLRNGVAAAATQFGGSVGANVGTQQGALIALGLAPVNCENVWCGVATNAATGSAVGAATAPIVCGAIYLD